MIDVFKVNIPQSDIDDLKERIKKTRWFDDLENSGWKYGTSLSYLKELSEYWEQKFDWKKIEKNINSLPNFTTKIDNYNVHFLHIKSDQEKATPLLITHGWPGSFLEMLKIIPQLSDFNLVIPSIVGFGFSDNRLKSSLDYDFLAELWHQLMTKLGYQKYGLQGGDIGAGISIRLAQKYSKSIIGLHLNYISDSYQPYTTSNNGEGVKEYKKQLDHWNKEEGAYSLIQSTKPMSLAYGLNDSPIGLCAWIIEKFNAWSDHRGHIENSFSKDELLANVSLYWFTKTIYSSVKIYNGIRLKPLIFKANDFVGVPVGFAKFPNEIPVPPRQYIEKGLNIVHWTEMSRGGHFAALEEPELLALDLKLFFEKLE